MEFKLSDIPLIINGISCGLLVSCPESDPVYRFILWIICGITIVLYGNLRSKQK